MPYGLAGNIARNAPQFTPSRLARRYMRRRRYRRFGVYTLPKTKGDKRISRILNNGLQHKVHYNGATATLDTVVQPIVWYKDLLTIPRFDAAGAGQSGSMANSRTSNRIYAKYLVLKVGIRNTDADARAGIRCFMWRGSSVNEQLVGTVATSGVPYYSSVANLMTDLNGNETGASKNIITAWTERFNMNLVRRRKDFLLDKFREVTPATSEKLGIIKRFVYKIPLNMIIQYENVQAPTEANDPKGGNLNILFSYSNEAATSEFDVELHWDCSLYFSEA